MTTFKVLLVDNNRINRSLLKSYLLCLKQELNIVEFYSAEEAKNELLLGKTDLLITGLQLPGLSGANLISHSISNRLSKFNVLMSMQISSKTKKLADMIGADFLLNKPVNKADFLDSVERLLGIVTSVLPSELSIKDQRDSQGNKSNGLLQNISWSRKNAYSAANFVLNNLGEIILSEGKFQNDEFQYEIIDEVVNKLQGNKNKSRIPALKPPLIIRKNQFEIHVSHLGESYIFISIFKSGSPKLTKQNYIDTQKTVMTLLDYFSRIGVSTNFNNCSSAPPILSAKERALFDSELASWCKHNPIHKTDADRYWGNLDQEDNLPAENLFDSLSYQQAYNLGLAPANIGAD